jgi:hypothetical protein
MATMKGGNAFKDWASKIAGFTNGVQTLRVGFKEDAAYPDGTSVPLVAAFNEYGVPARHQPPRPFFRRMIKAKQGEWPKAMADLLKANNYNVKLVLGLTGVVIEGQLRQSIIDLVDPPLSPYTIARKGFDKPLIDTKLMLNSVTHEVRGS